MVFENLTLFEIDLNGAHFGPRMTPADEAASDEMATTDSSGRGRVLPVLFVLALSIAGAMLYRRSRRSDFEFDREADTAEADLAEAQ